MTRRARVGTGCLPVFLLLSTIQALSPKPALAQGPQANGAVIACVDPRAVYALTDRNRPEHHNAKWRAGVERRGRCLSIPPGEHWEPIYRSGGLMVMRRTPPEPGVPPLFFRMGALPAGASDAIVPPRGSAPRPVPPTPQRPDVGSTDIVTEALPSPAAVPPPSPVRQAPTPIPAPAPPAAAVPAGAVMPGKAIAALPTPRPAVPATAPLPSAPPAKAASTAAARGYAVGFAMAILLVVLLLAALALLLLLLFRRPRNGTPSRRDAAADDPLLSPQAPRAASQPVRPPGPPALVLGAVPAPAPAALQPAGLPNSEWPPDDNTDIRGQCAVLLREAGWHTGVGMTADHPDLVARRDGRVMVLRCLTDTTTLDEHAVEEVCMAREREQADIAVIVSNASCTKTARQLAARTGVDLLREDELRDYAA